MQRDYTILILSFYYESRRAEAFLLIIYRQGEILTQAKQIGPQMYFVYLKARFVNGWVKRSPAEK